MTRLWRTWVVFAVCLAVVLGSMAWISFTALRLAQKEAGAREQAILGENVRLALWRMDCALLPLLARESARSVAPNDAASAEGNVHDARGAPSLAFGSEHIHLRFQIGPDGVVTSRQPLPNDRPDAAASVPKTQGGTQASGERLGRLREIVRGVDFRAALRSDGQDETEVDLHAVFKNDGSEAADRGGIEWTYRSATHQAVQHGVAPPEGAVGPMRGAWIGGQLLLARHVTRGGKEYVQGCWLDWPGLERALCGRAKDLLPWARLEAVTSPPSEDDRERMLAGIPVKLVPGAVPVHVKSWVTPIRYCLILGWACVMLPAIGAAFLLLGTITLGERRAAFVSAVTHELRTPLTTLQMYTEMLDTGMVRDEAKRQQYLRTMCVEADRLGHLVENVLAYARLERNRMTGRVQSITLFDLFDRVKARLANRAQLAGMEFRIESELAQLQAVVKADPSAVEQILFNLVDNACKYASGALERVVHLGSRIEGRQAVLRVWDHGPGISRKDARRLFHPFSKTDRDAVGNAPGVGLGLALSRRFARKMGGDLRLDVSVTDGACFVLTIPLAAT